MQNTTAYRTQTKRKGSKANQLTLRTMATVRRLAAKGVPLQTLQQVQSAGLKRAATIARTNPKPKPQTNRYNPRLAPKGNALQLVLIAHTFSTKNMQGQTIQQYATYKAWVTTVAPGGVLTCTIPQRGNNPAQLVQVSTAYTGFTLPFVLLAVLASAP